jgi:hypothetical protein
MNQSNNCSCPIGICQIFGGIVCCPIVSTGSLLWGTGLTVKACCQARCIDEDFCKDRRSVCEGCGLYTGAKVSVYMIMTGKNNITRVCQETDMVR